MSHRSLGSGFALIAGLLLSACSGDDGASFDPGNHPSPPDSGTDSGDTGSADTAPPSGNSYSVTLGPVTLKPGQESVVCVEKRVPSDHATDIVKIAADLTEGGHHLIFYKSNATEESTTPTPCSSFRGILGTGGSVPLFIAQKSKTELNFPPGIAYTLPAGQMVRVEMHFLNTTSQDLPISGTVHLGEAKSGTVVDHANLLFYGTLAINIPPMSTKTVGPMVRTFKGATRNVFGITGHQHHRGTGFLIEHGDKAGPMTKLYENHDWAEPPLTTFDPAIPVRDGQAFRYTCTYDNPTNTNITFGEGANQEMCFLWAYYYPDMGFEFGIDAAP
jgi:hypothetical protein